MYAPIFIKSIISISGTPIAFSNSAEHVGIVRSIEGNLPNILERLSAHKRAVFSVLSAGLGRGQSGNPAASLRVERLYGIPVMLSGLATMVLSKTELAMIDTHFKIHIERLLKLHRATPECVFWFQAGVLGTACPSSDPPTTIQSIWNVMSTPEWLQCLG